LKPANISTHTVANIVGILLGASHSIPKRGLKMIFVQDTPSFASAIIDDITLGQFMSQNEGTKRRFGLKSLANDHVMQK
jgi:hypothetical protein